MRSKIIIVSFLIVTIGIASFGFSNKKNTVKNDNIVVKLDSLKVNKNVQKADLLYMVGGTYSRSVTKSKLLNSSVLGDFIRGYPTNWISTYISVEITSDYNGVKTSLLSKSDVLSIEQKIMFTALGVDADVTILVKYNTKNLITNALEESEMNVSLTVIPEIEAEFIGGYDKMIAYLKKNSAGKIAMISNAQFQSSVIKFTIGKSGKAENVMLMKTTGNAEIDTLLIKLIENMSKWNSAKNQKNESVSQQFEFKIGGMGGC